MFGRGGSSSTTSAVSGFLSESKTSEALLFRPLPLFFAPEAPPLAPLAEPLPLPAVAPPLPPLLPRPLLELEGKNPDSLLLVGAGILGPGTASMSGNSLSVTRSILGLGSDGFDASAIACVGRERVA